MVTTAQARIEEAYTYNLARDIVAEAATAARKAIEAIEEVPMSPEIHGLSLEVENDAESFWDIISEGRLESLAVRLIGLRCSTSRLATLASYDGHREDIAAEISGHSETIGALARIAPNVNPSR